MHLPSKLCFVSPKACLTHCLEPMSACSAGLEASASDGTCQDCHWAHSKETADRALSPNVPGIKGMIMCSSTS